MKIALAGAGAFGEKHLDALAKIDGVEVSCLVDPQLASRSALVERYRIARTTTRLEEALTFNDIDAVILSTPTPLHAAQTMQCLDAGKHVMAEIPAADNLRDAQAIAAKQRQTQRVCMVGHTRRFNPSHQWVHQRIQAGELAIQHLDVQTFFFRRTNMNAKGQPRSWTDHLLWHHAAHTVDLFQYQTGSRIVQVAAMAGPAHPDLGIAMDMSIQLKTESGQLCSLTLSFNNDGPLGTCFRYICDDGTYIARYDELITGRDAMVDVSAVDVSLNGVELQDREFVAAIREGREPNASIHSVLPCYEVLNQLEATLTP